MGSDQGQAGSRVGEPKQEAAIVQAAVDGLDRLLRPGPGRQRLCATEVELGVGRPDLLVAAASLGGLTRRAESGLRLSNVTEARVLGAVLTGSRAGLTQQHERAVIRRLMERGWIGASGNVAYVPQLISDSLLIEAKVKDWKSGLAQLSRSRWATHRAAVLLPRKAAEGVPRRVLKRNRLGLIVADGSPISVQWAVTAPRNSLSWVADVWIAELLMRLMERSEQKVT